MGLASTMLVAAPTGTRHSSLKEAVDVAETQLLYVVAYTWLPSGEKTRSVPAPPPDVSHCSVVTICKLNKRDMFIFASAKHMIPTSPLDESNTTDAGVYDAVTHSCTYQSAIVM
jgi:hypothetical protein